MKFTLLSLIYILARALVANGQLATIKDPDGFTNVRAGKGTNTKIIGRLNEGEVFTYSYAKSDEWVNVFYFPADFSDSGYMQGYIHKDRLLPIDELPHLPENGKCRILGNGHLTLRNDTVTVELHIAPFQAKQHVIRKDRNGMLQKIDGRRPVGSDGGIPYQKLTSLRMTIRGNSVHIPVAAWNDVYEPTLETCNVFFDSRTGFMYIYIPDSSDGGGAYMIAWVFKNGRYVRRYIGFF